MKKIQKMIVLIAALALVAAFVALVAAPSQNVSATTEYRQQGDEACRECHKQPSDLWQGSRHSTGNVSCIVCHKLAQSGRSEALQRAIFAQIGDFSGAPEST